jgi:hypothetical protein
MQESKISGSSGEAMRSVVRILAVAAIAAAMGVSTLTSARADARLWDGTLFVTSATPQCDAIGEDFPNSSLRAIYRPKLKASDPKAAIIVQTDNLSHIYVVRAISDTATLSGNGEYCGIDFDPGKGESSTWFGGKYNITVTPPTVTQQSQPVNISVTGWVTKFGNVPGCTLGFRGAFLRRP